MNKSFSIVLSIMVLSLVTYAADVEFPRTVKVAEQKLELAGTGTLSKWFIKGCKMALYTSPGIRKENLLQDEARCLEFSYYRDIKAQQFAVAAWDTLKKNWTGTQLASVKKDIDLLHGIYRDVSQGDRYKLLYIPDTGTSLFLNGRLLGTVKGAEFAKMYYSVWLGDKPIDRRLKQNLTSELK